MLVFVAKSTPFGDPRKTVPLDFSPSSSLSRSSVRPIHAPLHTLHCARYCTTCNPRNYISNTTNHSLRCRWSLSHFYLFIKACRSLPCLAFVKLTQSVRHPVPFHPQHSASTLHNLPQQEQQDDSDWPWRQLWVNWRITRVRLWGRWEYQLHYGSSCSANGPTKEAPGECLMGAFLHTYTYRMWRSVECRAMLHSLPLFIPA